MRFVDSTRHSHCLKGLKNYLEILTISKKN